MVFGWIGKGIRKGYAKELLREQRIEAGRKGAASRWSGNPAEIPENPENKQNSKSGHQLTHLLDGIKALKETEKAIVQMNLDEVAKIKETALNEDSTGMSWTFNDAMTFLEKLMDMSKLKKAQGNTPQDLNNPNANNMDATRAIVLKEFTDQIKKDPKEAHKMVDILADGGNIS